jgi:hypothetical protein
MDPTRTSQAKIIAAAPIMNITHTYQACDEALKYKDAAPMPVRMPNMRFSIFFSFRGKCGDAKAVSRI